MDRNTVITKESLVAFKSHLVHHYKTTSINSILVALNGFLEYINLSKLRLKLHKIQKKMFYEEDRELTKNEYKRLLEVALKHDNQRLYILIQTICGTDIRVSEHKFITVEAIRNGKAIINNKGKMRVIIIPKKLKKILIKYCKDNAIHEGAIFITKNKKPINRSNIWTSMKKLCKDANVEPNKVFPHNLRHLFALTFYRLQKDVVRLADILGHTSINTTRIYTMTSSYEYQKSLAKMDLIE